jgi:DMSO/TMAO reductase YedYZ molybdopterin-dependent catalytic subunit
MSDTNRERPEGQRMDRRGFLRNTAQVLPLAYLGYAGAVVGQATSGEPPLAQPQDYPGLIVRQYKPENFEFPFCTLNSFLTPNNLFYVRCHFGIYKGTDLNTWRLKVEGRVERPLDLTHEDLQKMPARTQTTLLECSGNSRVFLVPKAEGVPWELGAVSNAEWAGVPLAAVLDRAGLKSDAVDVIFEGADSGELPGNKEEPKSPGKIHFARSLPLEKARQPDLLLAYKMNGEDLPAAHGYPLRLLVPGWYGMASVKWLKRIIVTERPFRGIFQTMLYSYYERRDGLQTLVPTTELQVKSEIARPARSEVVKAETSYRVHGAAWTGESEVAKVEVSADGGKTWQEAKLLDKSAKYAWRLWEYPWRTPGQAGRYTLMARATDKRGRTQPMEHDPDRRNALVSHVLPLGVEVR